MIVGLLGREAMAQVTTVPFRVEDGEIIEIPTVQEQVEDTYFTNSQDFYRNQRFPRTLWPIFGIVENDIGGDGRRINELYRELLEQQIEPFTLIRVADFPNPFTGSLATTPLFVEEPLPPPAIPRIVPGPPTTAPVPGVQPPAPQQPPPALW
ncbi:hypothetical protein [Egbenema bharatensis]|uniref:hypothetical protein n=1 Tax=Egbenema bharatensis TaxID=3463334 RepID=UPI003A89DC73